jgi:hypothetical protein
MDKPEKRPLTSKEISAIVDGFNPIDWVQMEAWAKLSPGERFFAMIEMSEMIRTNLRNKLKEDFPELSMSEINMKVLRSLTPVRMGKTYTEPVYYGSFG